MGDKTPLLYISSFLVAKNYIFISQLADLTPQSKMNCSTYYTIFIAFSALHLTIITICSVNPTRIAAISKLPGVCKLYTDFATKVDFSILDCSYRDLETVPQNLYNKVLHLSLNNKKLTSITGSPFKELVLLQVLTLKSNNISHLSDDVFHGLSSLKELRINSNKLKVLKDDLFLEVINLQKLDLQDNLLTQIPNKAVAPLHSLQRLNLFANPFDSFTLRKEFTNLTNLELLAISPKGDSLQQDITNETFQYFMPKRDNVAFILSWHPYNTVVSFGKLVNVTEISMPALPLDQFKSTNCHLKFINLPSRTDLNVSSLRAFTRWNTTLSTLDLSIGSTASIQGPVFAWAPFLYKLDLSFNKIRSISDDAFTGLKHLEQLSLAKNRLLEVPSWALKVFTKYARLKHLDLSYNSITGSIPKDAFVAVPFLISLNLAGNWRIKFQPDWTTVLVNLTELNLEDSYPSVYYASYFPSLRRLLLGIHEPVQFPSPLNVRKPLCDFATLITHITLFNFQPFEDDIVANVLGNECPYLTNLDISGTFSDNKAFHKSQLAINLTNLQTLSIAHNEITNIKQIIFMKTPQLKELDLSYNKIVALEMHHVPFLGSLQNVNLEGNLLVSLDGTEILASLDTLLAAKNQITTVPNFLLNKSPQSALRTLDLGANPFDCTCDIMPFKQWMMTDNITWLVPNDLYLCAGPPEWEGFNIVNINLDCRSKMPLYLGTSISTAVLILILIGLAFRYRWHIKYKLFLILNYRRIKNYANIRGGIPMNDLADINYPLYDAYIAYAEENTEDEHWVLDDLSPNLEEGPEAFHLCIKRRDFIPGSQILESISQSIQQSEKTVLILSPRFVESEWCYFEMQTARMRLFNENKDVLILVLLEEIPDNKLTLSLRQLLCVKDYFKWPADNMGRKLFWKRLSAELRKPVHIDRRYII